MSWLADFQRNTVKKHEKIPVGQTLNYLFIFFKFSLDLDDNMRKRLKELLDQQINGLLTKIEEESLSDANSASISE